MNVAKVVYDYFNVVSGIKEIINSQIISKNLSRKSLILMKTSGPQKLSKVICALININ